MKTPLPTPRANAVLWAAILAVVLAAGCASAPARFYTLSVLAQSGGARPTPCAVAVGPVAVPAMVDHPQLALQLAANRVERDEFDRWAEPLGENIARVVAGDLAIQLGAPQVVAAPLAGFQPAYRVSLNLQRFESAPGKSVLVEALWVVRPAAAGPSQSGQTIVTEPVAGNDCEALVAAHSRALVTVSADIATAIRTLAKPAQ